MFITNNHVSPHFWWKENLEKHQKDIKKTHNFISYRNQSIDLRSKSMDWFLYDMNIIADQPSSL